MSILGSLFSVFYLKPAFLSNSFQRLMVPPSAEENLKIGELLIQKGRNDFPTFPYRSIF